MKWRCLVAGLLLGACALAQASALSGQLVRICAGNWPPIMYTQPETEQVVGVAVDIVGQIVAAQGGQAVFSVLPWKRCLINLMAKDADAYHLSPYVTFNEERAKLYLFSQPWFLSRGYYVYNSATYPQGLQLDTRSALNNTAYTVCGRMGFNYIQFGMLSNELVYRQYKSLTQMIQGVALDRCDFMLARAINLTGERYLENGITVFDNPEFGYAKVPDMPAENVYHMLNKHSAFSEALLRTINQGVQQLWQDGTIKASAKAHLEQNWHILEKPYQYRE